MQAKKFLSAALSAVLIGSIASSAVSAVPAETPSPKTYNYVAGLDVSSVDDIRSLSSCNQS